MLAFLVFAFLLGTPAASAQVAPPAGSWAQVPNTKLTTALSAPLYAQGFNVRDVFANSGGDLARWQGVLGFFLSGGGHAATPDNSLFFVPLDGSGPRRLLGPYYRPDGAYKQDTPAEIYLPFGVWTDAPRSRHSYSCIVYMERLGKPAVFMFAGAPYTGPGGGLADPRWADLSLTFEQQMARPDMGWQRTSRPPWPTASGQCAWDPVRKRVVLRSAKAVGAYLPDTNTWEDWHAPSDATYCCDFDALAAIDVVGRWMYVLGATVVERYHLDTKAYQSLRGRPWAAPFAAQTWAVPPAYPNGFGLAWHERTRQLIVLGWNGWAGGNGGDAGVREILAIDPATDRVSRLPTMSGDAPRNPGIYGSYGRIRIVPGTDQIVSLASTQQNVYIGALPVDAPPQTTPIAPAGLVVN